MPIYVTYIADALMIAASFGAACYCLVLSRRLSRLTSFDKGIGGAIAVLSAQVDDMKAALAEAKAGSEGAGGHLHELVRQARDISGELELMIAACHDFAEEALIVQSNGADASPVAKDLPAADRAVNTDSSATEGPVSDAASPPEAAVTPMFGSRRAPPPEPVFRHRGQAQA